MKDKLSLCVKCNKEVYRSCEQYWCGVGFKTIEEYHNSLPKLKNPVGVINWEVKS